MIGYIIVALIFLVIGACLTRPYYRIVLKELHAAHQDELERVKKEWFEAGHKRGVEYEKKENEYRKICANYDRL
jgi:uncharacterized membrane protein